MARLANEPIRLARGPVVCNLQPTVHTDHLRPLEHRAAADRLVVVTAVPSDVVGVELFAEAKPRRAITALRLMRL